MKKVEIEWHKYPDEKPKRDGDYLVTVKRKKRSFTSKFYWDSLLGFGDSLNELVSAYADMPEPYKED